MLREKALVKGPLESLGRKKLSRNWGKALEKEAGTFL